jgi:hypothetical protein
MLDRKGNCSFINMNHYHDYWYLEDGVKRKSELKFGVKSSVLLGIWGIPLSISG